MSAPQASASRRCSRLVPCGIREPGHGHGAWHEPGVLQTRIEQDRIGGLGARSRALWRSPSLTAGREDSPQ